MKTIFMVCRSEKETPHEFLRLMETLFPECEVHLVYEPKQRTHSPQRSTGLAGGSTQVGRPL